MSGPERQLTAFMVGVNCGTLGVGEAGGTVVNVGEGGNAGVIVLAGELAPVDDAGVEEAKRGKLHAIVNSINKVKRVKFLIFMASPLRKSDYPIWI